MPEEGIKSLAEAAEASYSFVFIRTSFILFLILSRESVNSQCFQSMFRIFSSKVQISRIPGKAALCLQTNLGNGSLLQSDCDCGKKTDGTG